MLISIPKISYMHKLLLLGTALLVTREIYFSMPTNAISSLLCCISFSVISVLSNQILEKNKDGIQDNEVCNTLQFIICLLPTATP
jgi:hypothetical protein